MFGRLLSIADKKEVLVVPFHKIFFPGVFFEHGGIGPELGGGLFFIFVQGFPFTCAAGYACKAVCLGRDGFRSRLAERRMT